MRFLTTSILALALAGCSNPVQMRKAGATDADYQRDKKICEAQAERAARGQMAPRDKAAAHNRVLLGCMRERGWEQVPD